MLDEITIAANFLVRLLRIKPAMLSEHQLNLFQESVSNILQNRYREHWFPQNPEKGSAFRCIRINSKMDPIIAQAAAAIGIHPLLLRTLLPLELTIWIDPAEVSYRIGENGSICVLYESKESNPPLPCQSPEVYLNPWQYSPEVYLNPWQYSPEVYLNPWQYY